MLIATMLSHGEVLKTLILKSKMEHKDVAMAIDLHPKYLSKLQKEEKLTLKVRKDAAKFFNVPIEVFSDPTLLSAEPMRVEEERGEYKVGGNALDRIADSIERMVTVVDSQARVIESQMKIIEKLIK